MKMEFSCCWAREPWNGYEFGFAYLTLKWLKGIQVHMTPNQLLHDSAAQEPGLQWKLGNEIQWREVEAI